MYAASGDLVLYKDPDGRLYAIAPESVGGTSCNAQVLDYGIAYVVFPTRRGLAYDVTEDELPAAYKPPHEGAEIRVRADFKGAAQVSRGKYPSSLVLRIDGVHRDGSRCTGTAEITIVKTTE